MLFGFRLATEDTFTALNQITLNARLTGSSSNTPNNLGFHLGRSTQISIPVKLMCSQKFTQENFYFPLREISNFDIGNWGMKSLVKLVPKGSKNIIQL